MVGQLLICVFMRVTNSIVCTTVHVYGIQGEPEGGRKVARDTDVDAEYIE